MGMGAFVSRFWRILRPNIGRSAVIGSGAGFNQDPRRSVRFGLSAEITLRRAGHAGYRAKIFDVSAHGCKAEFIERPELDELVWVRFDGLELLGAIVCWVSG